MNDDRTRWGLGEGAGSNYWNSVVSWYLDFEWHDAKAMANLQAHGVSFELAKSVFEDSFAIEFVDDREDYGEARFVIIGMAEGQVLLFVAYTERDERIRVYFRPEGHKT